MTYDWNIPQTQPAPKRKTRRGLIAVLALIAVLLISATTFVMLRASVPEPIGLSASQMRGAFQDGQLAGCDLGEDFYRTAGITNISTSDEGCEGVIDDGENQASVLVVVEEYATTELIDTTPTDPALQNWRQGTAPSFFSDSPAGELCTLTAPDGPLAGTVLQTDANCEATYPLARHFTNTATWYEAQQGFSRFTADSPVYLEIPTPQITPLLSERDASEFIFSAIPQFTYWAVGFRDSGRYCSFNERSGEDYSPLAFLECSISGILNPEMVPERTTQVLYEANVVSYEEGIGFEQQFSPGSQGLPSAPTFLNPGEQVTVGDTTVSLSEDGEVRVSKNGDSMSIVNNELTINNG